jgi:hypothetical protein
VKPSTAEAVSPPGGGWLASEPGASALGLTSQDRSPCSKAGSRSRGPRQAAVLPMSVQLSVPVRCLLKPG